jgi:hypothetical protein
VSRVRGSPALRAKRSACALVLHALTLHVALALAAPLSAQERPRANQEGALFLLLPVGAQAIGLARAVTALESAEAAFWNPAGLAVVPRGQVLLYHGNHLTGDATGFTALAVRQGVGTVGLSYSLLDESGIDVTDDQGTVVGSIAVRGHQGVLSAARAVTTWLSAGLNAKVVSSGVTCRGQCPEGTGQATTWAADGGLQVRPLSNQPLVIGVMVAHVGRRLREGDADEPDPLPSRIRLGASYRITRELLEEEFGVRLLAEFEDHLRNPGRPQLFIASELTAGASDQLFVRGGFIFADRRNQTDAAAIGFGLRYERLELGIARSLARGGPTLEQEPVHLTLGLAF